MDATSVGGKQPFPQAPDPGLKAMLHCKRGGGRHLIFMYGLLGGLKNDSFTTSHDHYLGKRLPGIQ